MDDFSRSQNEFDKMMKNDDAEMLRHSLNDLHSSIRSIEEANTLVADTTEKKEALVRLKALDRDMLISAVNRYVFRFDLVFNDKAEPIEELIRVAEDYIIDNLRDTPMKNWTLNDYTLLKRRGMYS